jgi:hypothetical protein
MRDDFNKDIKEILAKRVGYKCSNPNCRKPTSGPNEDPNKSVNIGVAAHITAASVGGPRYDQSLTIEQRKDIKNGIWLCQNCAKLIDSDEKRYSVPLIGKWKELSEEAASLEIEYGPNEKVIDNTTVISINQQGGQTAKTIVNLRAEKRDINNTGHIIKSYLDKVPPMECVIHVLMNDLEAFDLATQIKIILESSGWKCGNIIKGLGGYYPPGVTITRDKESTSSDNLLEGVFRTGLKNVTGQLKFKGDKIAIYVGPNPDKYL